MENQMTEIEAAVAACNAVAVPDPIRRALVRDLGPVADRLATYTRVSQNIAVENKSTADHATEVCGEIAADIKLIKEHEVLSQITSGLHDLHRRWTGLRDLFIAPMIRDRERIKAKIIFWQEIERKKAEEIQRRLQAEADAKARMERGRQEAEARRQRAIEKQARMKSEEARQAAEQANGRERARLEAEANAAERKANAAAVKAEDRAEQAAAVIAPTVSIDAPKSGLRTAKAWKVHSLDERQFYAALANEPSLRGFVDISRTRMERAKAANPSAEIPGVVFEQITR